MVAGLSAYTGYIFKRSFKEEQSSFTTLFIRLVTLNQKLHLGERYIHGQHPQKEKFK